MNKLVIITSYVDNELNLTDITNDADYIICTDGGFNIAVRHDITPDLLLGDFDSIEGNLPQNIEIKRFNPEKDYTDLELAIITSEELQARRVYIIGGIGGRLDHTVANLQLLSHYSDCFDELVMLDGKNKCFVLNKNQKKGINISVEKNSYISLFSLSDRCCGVTISGVKYPLNNHILTRYGSLGVSNEFKEKNAALSVKDGDLLVVLSKE